MRSTLIALATTAASSLSLHAQKPLSLEITDSASSLTLGSKDQPSGRYVIERSQNLRDWEQFIFTDAPESLETIQKNAKGSEIFRLRDLAAPAIWCDALKANRSLNLAIDNAFNNSCGFGLPDDPDVRDAAIPDASTPFKTIATSIHIIEKSATDPTTTTEQVEREMARVASLFEPHRIRFDTTIRTVIAPSFAQFLPRDLEQTNALKTEFTDEPNNRLNIYIVDFANESSLGGFAVFPWDPRALTPEGGIMMNSAANGFIDGSLSVLAHEIGHTLGLFHTHRGSTEVEPCGPCYESVSTLDRDIVGDYCSDTPPSPLLRSCQTVTGTDPCSSLPWSITDTNNIMSYSGCLEQFTPQQAGRMHAWITARLTPWLVTNKPTGLPIPTNVLAQIKNQNDVEISWEPNPTFTHNISRSTNPIAGEYIPLATIPAGQSNFLDTTTEPGTVYHYCIRTSGGPDDTTSEPACANPIITDPPIDTPLEKPTNLALSLTTSGAVKLEWVDNSTRETRHEIERSTNNGAFTNLTSRISNDKTLPEFTDETVSPGSIYQYRVRGAAFADIGQGPENILSEFSNIARITIRPPAVPFPTELNVTHNAEGHALLQWKDNATDETGFEIQRATDPSRTFTRIATIPANASTTARYTDTTTVDGLLYLYRVRTLRGATTSGFSANSDVLINLVTPPAEKPILTSPAQDSTERLRRPNFTWEAITNADSYRIQVFRLNTGDRNAVVHEFVSTTTTFQPEIANALVGDRRHQWHVRAENKDGFGPWSDRLTFRTQIGKPAPIAPANAATGTSIAPTFTWNTTPGASSYRFEIAPDEPDTGRILSRRIKEGNITTTTIPSSDPLRAGRLYFWRVTAIGVGQNPSENTSDWFSFTTVSQTLTTPNLTSPANGTLRVARNGPFNWSDVEGAISYRVLFTRVNTMRTLPAFITTESRLEIPPEKRLVADREFTWTVTAIGEDGTESPISARGDFRTRMSKPQLLTPAVGASTNDRTPTFTWSPIPGADSYTIKFARNADGSGLVNQRTKIVTDPTYTSTNNFNVNQNRYWQITATGPTDSNISEWRLIRINGLNQAVLQNPSNDAVEIPRNVFFNWSDVPGATSYRLTITQNSDSNLVVTYTSPTSGFRTPDTAKLAADRVFRWKVEAFGPNGLNGDATPEFSFRTRVSKPQLLTPAASAGGTNLPTFSWEAIPGVSKYTLEIARNADGSQPNDSRRRENLTVTSFRYGNVFSGSGTRYWRVTAFGPTTNKSSDWRPFVLP